MVERLIRTPKEQWFTVTASRLCSNASRVIGDWISFYNTRRPLQALGMKTPVETYALAA
jgi:putative transposase